MEQNKLLLNLKSDLKAFMDLQKRSPCQKGSFSIPTRRYMDPLLFLKEQNLIQTSTRFLGIDQHLGPEFLQSEKCVFKNACVHRGARLTKNSDGFTCPFHGWKYNQDGRLQSATGIRSPLTINLTSSLSLSSNGHKPLNSPANSSRKNLSLPKIRTQTLAGAIFQIDQSLAFENEIEFLTKNYSASGERSRQVQCNWKLQVESLLETYHFQFAHQSRLKNFENSFYSMPSTQGTNARTVVPMSDFENHRSADDASGVNIMYFFFPSTFLLVMKDNFTWFHIQPETIERCRLQSFHFRINEFDSKRTIDDSNSKNLVQSPNEAVSQKSNSGKLTSPTFDTLGSILEEDIEILEGQQKNLPHLERFLMTPYESLIQHFHNSLDEMILINEKSGRT